MIMKGFGGLVQGCMILITVAIGICLASPAIAEQATDGHLIKIMPDFKKDKADELIGFHLDPSTVNMKKNSIALWMNGAGGKDLQVVFSDGKTCKDVTANPRLVRDVPSFFSDAKGCYSTTYLPYSETTALQFVHSGAYHYIVQSEDGKMSAEGKIIVSD